MSTRNWCTCEPCGKRAYYTRRGAQAVAKTHRGAHMTAYPCPVDDRYWHLGHLPRPVVHGAASKVAYREKVLRRIGVAT